MAQCNRCYLQFIGETKQRLKDRFNEHRCSVHKTNRLIKSKPTTVPLEPIHLNLSTPRVIQSEKLENIDFNSRNIGTHGVNRGDAGADLGGEHS